MNPILALDGGEDGYDAYRDDRAAHPSPAAARTVSLSLNSGYGQATYVSDLAREAGLIVSFQLDLSQTPRAIVLRRPGH